MFWDRIEPILTPRLQAAVAQSYGVFQKYKLNGTITYCDCPSCMTADTAHQLSTLPLKNISASLLAEYTNSAHGYDRKVIEPEFKYFLPRYFDLIARCEPPSHLDLEACLVRLDGYRDAWPTNETEAVDDFFDAFVEASLQQLGLLKWPVGYRLEFDLGEVLIAIVLAGGDIERVLGTIDAGEDPAAAAHMASMRLQLGWRDGQYIYENAFLEDHPDIARRLGEWLRRDSVDERIIAASDQLDDPRYDDILNYAV
ncbi:MAG: hypothetical protein RIC14_13750 [Filomicrobium sp.]